MSRYSIGAYRIALEMRTARTLLVEGVTDKTVIQRLLLNVSAEGPKPSIDTPDLLVDTALVGLGNKAKVELIASQMRRAEKFLALVDREWESFDANELALEDVESDLSAKDGLLRTFGHSMENYFLEFFSFSALLRRTFAGQMSVGTFRLLEENFHSICSLALSFSLAAKDCQVIGIAGGLLSRRHIQFEGGKFSLRQVVKEDLLSRGVPVSTADQFLASVLTYQDRIADRRLSNFVLKWSCHGHLGGEVVWCCIARVVEDVGGDRSACDQIERGMKNDKLKHGADVLASEAHERRPLDWIVRWLHGLEDTAEVASANA